MVSSADHLQAVATLTRRAPTKTTKTRVSQKMYAKPFPELDSDERAAVLVACTAHHLSAAMVEEEELGVCRRRVSFESRNAVYVGRPMLMAYNYRVPQFAAGHYLANPFPVAENPVPDKSYYLSESLDMYKVYLNARAMARSRDHLETLCPPFPDKLKKYLRSPKAVSYNYLRLDLVGPEFVEHVLALQHSNLGCICRPGDACHADEILSFIATRKVPRESKTEMDDDKTETDDNKTRRTTKKPRRTTTACVLQLRDRTARVHTNGKK